MASEWNTTGQCALVVGATFPEELSRVRELAPGLPLLVDYAPGMLPREGPWRPYLLDAWAVTLVGTGGTAASRATAALRLIADVRELGGPVAARAVCP